MDNKKRNARQKPFESFMQELGCESMVRAPPPTPSLLLKQKSGSVPDIRLIDTQQKENLPSKATSYKSVNKAITCPRKNAIRAVFELNAKKSSSDHSLTSKNAKVFQWLVMGQAPTSHLLHSVRQKLLNL